MSLKSWPSARLSQANREAESELGEAEELAKRKVKSWPSAMLKSWPSAMLKSWPSAKLRLAKREAKSWPSARLRKDRREAQSETRDVEARQAQCGGEGTRKSPRRRSTSRA